MAYFNMIQCLESAGIGLVYGLRFYSVGSLGENDLMRYEFHNHAYHKLSDRHHELEVKNS